ncbi:MAG: methionine adenosyltransferase [Candidatus Thalassarchaeaceae archaeon]|nr:methionine adenosyltransferase [Candidatus Thalassarchaeaceae archaeon]
MAYLFTSESVSEGHPDKLCDHISDSILDACLSVDKRARVAVETMVKGTDEVSHIIVGGEVTLAHDADIDYEGIARRAAAEIGYTDHAFGMDALNTELCEVLVLISQQSADISQGVDEGKGLHLEQGAGDQGLMFGYASDESEEFPILAGSFMPLPAALAQRLTLELSRARKEGLLPWARPDAKSQVTVEYDGNGTPLHLETVVIAIQHDDLAHVQFDGDTDKERSLIVADIEEHIIRKIVPPSLLNIETKIIINGTGRFVLGGPHADAGLTGRKIIVDTYGGMGRHGGGAFSGKDPSKVDRSAAYAARWAAKHVVASGLSKKCEIQLAYAIGVAEPVSISVNVQTFGTGTIPNSELTDKVLQAFDFRPQAIIETLGLRAPIYARTAAGGHFGREPDNEGGFSWERLDEEKLSSLRA